ncbi:hypothetical protein [Trinickia acidisoli]|uniref:hypothetical protein n=1 Tax=Trinickia acidisoli TaxID=2767482 RepID=UPI001A8D9CD4|nr:hypothetical protein [Trinickia acidisoli]
MPKHFFEVIDLKKDDKSKFLQEVNNSRYQSTLFLTSEDSLILSVVTNEPFKKAFTHLNSQIQKADKSVSLRELKPATEDHAPIKERHLPSPAKAAVYVVGIVVLTALYIGALGLLSQITGFFWIDVSLLSLLNFLVILSTHFGHGIRSRDYYFIRGAAIIFIGSLAFSAFDLDGTAPDVKSIMAHHAWPWNYAAALAVSGLKNILSLGFAAIGAGIVGAAVLMKE